MEDEIYHMRTRRTAATATLTANVEVRRTASGGPPSLACIMLRQGNRAARHHPFMAGKPFHSRRIEESLERIIL
jgi:hypothetical protein